MATISYTYNLDTKTWTNPSGASGTSFLPSLTFGEKPTLEITLSGTLPQGVTSVNSWSCAIAKDWLKSTSPMARTTGDITYENAVFTMPIDTCTDRFLAVVDGQGQGVPCWMQITGYDIEHTPTVEITLPLLCNPALDPVGAGTIPPISVSEISASEIQGMIDASIATAQGITSTPYTVLSGASATIQPGKIYTLELAQSFTLSAVEINGYGEAVLFVKTKGFSLDFDGIQGFETAENMRYRILISWTPYGTIAEPTLEAIDD